MHRCTLAALALAGALPSSCGAASRGTAELGGAGIDESRVALSLRDATVEELVRVLALASGRTVVVDPSAARAARCARITVVTPGPVPTGDLFGVVATALEGSSLTLEATEGGTVLRARPGGAIPPDCVVEREASAAHTEPSPRPDRSDEVLAGIREVSPTERLVLRSAMELAIEDSTTVMRSVRVIPHEEDGRVTGIRLYGIRRSGVVAALGFMNGDLVTSIAGQPLTGPDAVLEAYTRAHAADDVSVLVVRRGVEVELRFRMVDALPPEPGEGAAPESTAGAE